MLSSLEVYFGVLIVIYFFWVWSSTVNVFISLLKRSIEYIKQVTRVLVLWTIQSELFGLNEIVAHSMLRIAK